MRIAYIINSMEGGGAQSPLPRIVEALEKAGAEVRVFALLRRNGLALPRLLAKGVVPVVREGSETDHFRALAWIIDQSRAWGADALWTSLTRATLLGQIAAKRLNIPVVSWQHNAYLKPWNERLLQWRATAADLWVADSAQVAELTRERLGVSNENLITWPIFAADPEVPQAAEWQPGQRLGIGSLGRLHSAKGYDLLIDALALLDQRGFRPSFPLRISIGGIGAEEAALKARARTVSVDIEFAGFIENPTEFLARQHLYLQPSRREGFCIAAHEAMQAGLPVVAAETGEMPYTINSRDVGLTFPVGDVTELAQALEDVLSRPERLAAIGQNARDRVLEKFSQERFDAVAAKIVGRLSVLVAS